MTRAPTTAILLAAGRGRRLRPHTDHTPKPLLPVDGRPTLDYVLVAAARAEIETVCVVTHHLGEQIEEFVGDGSAWGLTVVTCRQPSLGGTAQALHTAVSAFPSIFAGERPFLLTATDYVLPESYLRDLVQAHSGSKTDITISLKRLPPAEMVGSSSVAMRANGHIARIVEKPPADAARGSLSASLTFVLPAATRTFLHSMKRSPRGEFEIQDVVNRMLEAGYTASGLLQERPREWRHARSGPEEDGA